MYITEDGKKCVTMDNPRAGLWVDHDGCWRVIKGSKLWHVYNSDNQSTYAATTMSACRRWIDEQANREE